MGCLTLRVVVWGPICKKDPFVWDPFGGVNMEFLKLQQEPLSQGL